MSSSAFFWEILKKPLEERFLEERFFEKKALDYLSKVGPSTEFELLCMIGKKVRKPLLSLLQKREIKLVERDNERVYFLAS